MGGNGWSAWCETDDSGVVQKRVVWLSWPPDWNENYICPGDSGGPVYSSRGDLIGVISASVMRGDAKTQDRTLFTRVDVWPQLFSAAHEISLGASPSELPPYGDCRAHTAPPRK